MIPRLKELYKNEIKNSLKEKYGFKNLNMSPELEKIVINMGLGIDGNDSKIMKSCEEDLSKITGQKPVMTKFKKSISNFKTRKDTKAGLKVTLRKNKMYEFIDRLVNIALPRIKDFRGLSVNGFDKFGNYTFGVKEQIYSINGTTATYKQDNDLKREISLSASMNYEKYIFENGKIGVAYYGLLSSQNTLSLGGNAFYKMNF